MKKCIALLLVLIMAVSIVGCKDEEPTNQDVSATPTVAPTDTPEATPTPTPIVAADPYDAEGRALAMYGTPTMDGEIDDIWGLSGEMELGIISAPAVLSRGTAKVLWDDNYLYTLMVVTDPILVKTSANAYEQDSVEVFLDELCDKAESYGSDDVHYRVNFDNEQSHDNGDASRFVTAVKKLTDDKGAFTGFVVEMAVAFNETPQNDVVMGFELQINDAGMQGNRVGMVNLFDATGNAWSNPSVMGEIILKGKEGSVVTVSTKRLENQIATIEKMNLDVYVNADILDEPIAAGKALIGKAGVTQEEVDAAMEAIREAYAQLDDGSGMPDPDSFVYNDQIIDPFVMLDGTEITDPADWTKRKEELTTMYQYYMYGVWRDGSDEEVTYDYNNGTLTIHVKRISTGAEASFNVAVQLPSASVKAPEGGYPVVVGMHAGISEGTALANGYATITLNAYTIASDDTKHTGAFYNLYPYGDSWTEQTGVLMAWSWGASKVLDALEAGLGDELNINPENSIITGVSRWGKAAIVCGAFEERFRMVAPSCSGAGGTALFRYTSTGKTYDFSSKGGPSAYTYTENEPLGSLQSNSERGWFNDNFLEFSSALLLPFDQHLLSSLVADEDRYLFIIGSCVSEDWVNAPSMWFSYLATKEIYDFLGISDNIKINIHKEGHAVIEEDMKYMTQYFNKMVYGIEPTDDLSVLDTSVFDLDVNKDPVWDTFNEDWVVK